MRVLILGALHPVSRSVAEELGMRLAASGWTVTMRSSRRSRAGRLLDTIGTAWRRRESYDAALIEVFSGLAFVLAEVASWTLRRARKPYVLALHGGALPAFAGRQPQRVHRLIRSAAAVTAPSTYLASAFGSPTSPVEIVPNPISVADFPFRVRDNPRPRLIWLRAFHRIYDPVLACHVLARLRPEYPQALLTMIGPDKRDGTLDRVRTAVRRLDLEGAVRIEGPVPRANVASWLADSDVFLNTTSIDNAPLSVLEAQACGLCVVSTNAGGLPHVLTNDADALLVPTGDPEALTAGVQRVLTEPGLGERLSRGARSNAIGHDWNVVLPRWQAILQAAARS